MNGNERDNTPNFEYLREAERASLETEEQNRTQSLFEDPEEYFEARRVEIGKRMSELEERLKNASYDEEGQLVGNIEDSRYFKHAEKSKDSFNLYIFQTDIQRLTADTEEYKKKRETEKQELKVANDLLKIEQNKLSILDEEILKLHILLLSADNESLVENTKKLEEKRAEKLDRQEVISYLDNEVLQITTLINSNAPIIRRNIRMNNQLVKTLNHEIDTIKNKENSDYFDYEHFNRDMKELNDLKTMLEHINSYSKVGKNKTKEKEEKQTVNDKSSSTAPPKGPSDVPPKGPTDEPKKDETSKGPSDVPPKGPTDESRKDEPPKGPSDVPPKGPTDEPMGVIVRPDNFPSIPPVTDSLKPEKKDEKMDGFKLDFIEKYQYSPGERERRLNPDYKSDYSKLVSSEIEAFNRDNSMESERGRLRRDQIITRIRNASKDVMNAIRNFKDRNFPSREVKEARLSIMK